MQKLIKEKLEFARNLYYEFMDGFGARRAGVDVEHEMACKRVAYGIRQIMEESKSKEEIIKRMVELFRFVQKKAAVDTVTAYKAGYITMVERMKPLMRNKEFFKQERIIRFIGYKNKG